MFFCLLYRDRKRLLSLYNAVNDSDYKDAEALISVTLEESEPELELTVTVLNINAGYNDDILARCESLRGYMVFVGKVRDKQTAGMSVEEAVANAVNECIRENILREFFEEHKNEVVEMGIYEYDEELHHKVLREEGWEEGWEDGYTAKLISLIVRKIRKAKSPEIIAEELDEDIEIVRSIYDTALQFAPDYDEKKICSALKS